MSSTRPAAGAVVAEEVALNVDRAVLRPPVLDVGRDEVAPWAFTGTAPFHTDVLCPTGRARPATKFWQHHVPN